MSIQFPNLGINLDYVGKSIQIFGFEITFFGLVIALGMLLGMGFVILEAKRCGEQDQDHRVFQLFEKPLQITLLFPCRQPVRPVFGKPPRSFRLGKSLLRCL